jgi:hypothetical protein
VLSRAAVVRRSTPTRFASAAVVIEAFGCKVGPAQAPGELLHISLAVVSITARL